MKFMASHGDTTIPAVSRYDGQALNRVGITAARPSS